MRIFHMLRRLLPAIRKDNRGNIMMFLGLAIIPMTFGVGFGIDYSRAMLLRTKLNAAADAAALAGVSIIMIQKSDAEAEAAARAMFNKQVAGLNGLVYDATSASNPTVTISSTTGVNTSRTVTVSYTAQSTNIFGGVLGKTTLPLTGSATAYATRAPHIDFYLMLDTSPSMLLPSTSNGLTQIKNLTGCAFSCHVQFPHDDGIYIRSPGGKDIFIYGSTVYEVEKVQNGYIYYKNSSGTTVKGPKEADGRYADSMWATKNYGTKYPSSGYSSIELRVDSEQTAAEDLIPFAQNTANENNVTYRMQLFGFNFGNPTPLTGSLVDVDTMSAASVPNLMSQQPMWYKNNCPTSSLCNSDQATEFLTMFNWINSQITTVGTGQSASDPQKVIFLVTDGMSDEFLSGIGRNNRELRQAHLDKCTAIKNRGIRIAILYTEYLPEALTGNSWSETNVLPYLPNVEPALKACASAKADGSPLYYKVTTDQSISAALSALFSLTVSSAHLTQ